MPYRIQAVIESKSKGGPTKILKVKKIVLFGSQGVNHYFYFNWKINYLFILNKKNFKNLAQKNRISKKKRQNNFFNFLIMRSSINKLSNHWQ